MPRFNNPSVPSIDLITAETVFVTPELARKYLALNHPDQRPVSQKQVDAEVADILSGNYIYTHQGICFGKRGLLIDGQHRMHAIIKANKGVTMLVLHNPNGDVRDPMDLQRTRSMSYLLQQHPRVVGALGLLHKMERYIFASTTPVTKDQLETAWEHHETYLSMIAGDSRIPQKSKIIVGVRAACAWIMPINPEKTLDFLKKVLTGEMLSRGDPAYAFRAWKERTPRSTPIEVMLATCNCLQQHLLGRKLKAVYTTESGYKASVARRRAMRLPHTPGTNLVRGASWTGGNSGDDDE